jgi:glyoxylase-like metal-dependent hydrolase (beta-lactamase superfamily II)
MEVYVLKIKFDFQKDEDFLYPVILKNTKGLFLIDCGYAGFMPLIEVAATLQGLFLKDLTGIIITHDDIDHVGGLFEIKAKYPSIKVYSSKAEAPYLSGSKKSHRLKQAEDRYDALPEAQKSGALQFQDMLRGIQRVPVDYIFPENEDFAFWDEGVIINTPGHTPGHISIYLKDSKTLIAGDAVVVENGELQIANPAFTLNLEQAVTSVKHLLELEIDRIICYHGGVVESKIKQKLNKLVFKYLKRSSSI